MPRTALRLSPLLLRPLLLAPLLLATACSDGADVENPTLEDNSAERIAAYERAVNDDTPDGRAREVVGEGPDYTREGDDDSDLERYAVPNNTPPAGQPKYEQVGATECPQSQWLDLSDYEGGQLPPETNFEKWLLDEEMPEGIVGTESGLRYRVIQPGIERGYIPQKFDNVTVHYHGIFADGRVFDSSLERDETIAFKPGQVIAGWTEALMDMAPCEARTLYIPADLAYGPRGKGDIPPDTPLIFHVQMLEVDA